jgi:hypothetical protein
MTILLIYCAAALIVLALAQEQLGQQPLHDDADPSRACSIALIWPSADSIVLVAADSRSVNVYFKLMGDCSLFLVSKPNASVATQLELSILIYGYLNGWTRDYTAFEPGVAAPLNEDMTSVHYRMMRSPLLVKSSNPEYDTAGHSTSKQFSVWYFTVLYPQSMLNHLSNRDGLHELEPKSIMLEMHLLPNRSVSSSSIPESSAILKFQSFSKPSSTFYLIAPRYTRSAFPLPSPKFVTVPQHTWLRVLQRLRWIPSCLTRMLHL